MDGDDMDEDCGEDCYDYCSNGDCDICDLWISGFTGPYWIVMRIRAWFLRTFTDRY